LAASGWTPDMVLYDPCCGSGTIAIEAAQIACRIPAGLRRRFAFANLVPFDGGAWQALLSEAKANVVPMDVGEGVRVFGSDVSHRMVDFAQRNAERAGVAKALELRGGDALQRMPPGTQPGIMLLNPPYGERIAAAGVAGQRAAHVAAERGSRDRVWREAADVDGFADAGEGDAFFSRLGTHWKHHFAGWQAWLLTPDMKLPGKLRMKAARRVPMWNGPIECRLFRFDLTALGQRHGDANTDN
jgi:putative N6-adenine-specific DNA methylase